MSSPYLQTVPKQSVSIFKALSTAGDLTAKELAAQLHILPNAVYRAIKPLIELGMVEVLPTYPTTYRADSMSAALEWYLRAAVRSFQRDFAVPGPKTVEDNLPSITFIKDRDNLRRITEEEARKSKQSIDCILSGHRVADSTIADYRQAVARGVRLHVIIENDPTLPEVDLEAFRIMSAETKYLPNLGIRLFIFDKRTAVITSYDPIVPNRAFGIRFTYAPVAEQLGQLFERHWQEARQIN